MDMLAILLHLLLAVFGVDLAGSTHVHHDRVDGVDTLHGIATIEAGVARFECLASASGRCHFTVFPVPCAGAAPLARWAVGPCDAAPPRRFELPAGGGREIPGLAVHALCVRADVTRVGSDCAPTRPPATAAAGARIPPVG